MEIHKVDCGKFPFDRMTNLVLIMMVLSPQIDLPFSTGSPNTDTHAVRVAMLSAMFKNWSRLCIP